MVDAWVNEYDQPEHFQCPEGQFLSHINSMHNNHNEDRVLGQQVWTGKKILGCVQVNRVVDAWVNEYDQPENFQCPEGQFLSHINSIHDNHHEDRMWDFGCTKVPVDASVTNCQWTSGVTHLCSFTGYENDWDGLLEYYVPNGKILTGMSSYHDNGKEHNTEINHLDCSTDEILLTD
nr:hypothetical protein BaRGS_023737 [Batillaria attramentaria]